VGAAAGFAADGGDTPERRNRRVTALPFRQADIILNYRKE
jgi:hypothetical protein